MRATVLVAPGEVRLTKVAHPQLRVDHEALVRVSAAGICGSDLWAYNGVTERLPMNPIGHEFVGIVAEAGSAVSELSPGDEVVAPFSWSCAQCAPCKRGWTSSCARGGFFGRSSGADGAQSEYVRVPHADSTLLRLPPGTLGAPSADTTEASSTVRNVLLCGDVIATGRHAVALGAVASGDRCVVIGDGSVGLAAAAMARRAGAAEITLVGHHDGSSNLMGVRR